jgi:hypothetical protein
MNGSKTLKQVVVGILGGVSFCTIMLGIQAIVFKTNWSIFMICGVLLFIATLIIAKIIEA